MPVGSNGPARLSLLSLGIPQRSNDPEAGIGHLQTIPEAIRRCLERLHWGEKRLRLHPMAGPHPMALPPTLGQPGSPAVPDEV